MKWLVTLLQNYPNHCQQQVTTAPLWAPLRAPRCNWSAKGMAPQLSGTNVSSQLSCSAGPFEVRKYCADWLMFLAFACWGPARLFEELLLEPFIMISFKKKHVFVGVVRKVHRAACICFDQLTAPLYICNQFTLSLLMFSTWRRWNILLQTSEFAWSLLPSIHLASN